MTKDRPHHHEGREHQHGSSQPTLHGNLTTRPPSRIRARRSRASSAAHPGDCSTGAVNLAAMTALAPAAAHLMMGETSPTIPVMKAVSAAPPVLLMAEA